MTTQDHPVPGVPKALLAPLGLSAALVAPFIVLQWINRRGFQEEFPVALFTFMTVHSLLMVLALTPLSGPAALRRGPSPS